LLLELDVLLSSELELLELELLVTELPELLEEEGLELELLRLELDELGVLLLGELNELSEVGELEDELGVFELELETA